MIYRNVLFRHIWSSKMNHIDAEREESIFYVLSWVASDYAKTKNILGY